DTTVVRQANFIYNGIFGSNNANDLHGIRGISSFNDRRGDIAIDFRPWMGIGPGGLPWAHNNNLGALVDQLNLRLMAGQFPSTGTNDYTTNPRTIVNARQAIQDYVATLPYGKAITAISVANPSVLTLNGHGLTTGETVTISGVTGGPTGFATAMNAAHTVTVTGTNTFTVGVNRASGGTTLVLTNAKATPQIGFTDQLRDRVKSVVHFMTISPDFTIQK
ncbi:MAG: hypothetical protein ACRCXD_03790, partial [Luteolibacter sp.]